jgi:adenosylcobinamide kinase/adenosylcobinamide-phosphate guanylyltransferase
MGAAEGVAIPAALTLISGPAGGGKSRWAEQLAAASTLSVVYLATGPSLPDDPDWQERLRRHRSRRPEHWQCREVGGELAPAVAELQEGQIGLVDSLGTWVAAHLHLPDDLWRHRCIELQATLALSRVPLLLVCEEVGWGLVPPSSAGGRFRNRLPPLQRRLAERADACWLVLQGRALDLRRLGLPVDPD